MAITSVSRLKGPPPLEDTRLFKEGAAVLKKHGAVSVRLALCHAGAYAGQTFIVTTYPDWTTYGRANQAFSEDADFRRLLGELLKTYELQERYVSVTEDL
jgi:hypothetical protein